MSRPWNVVEAVDTDEGALELRRRGENEYLITVGGRVLMNSAWHRSELAVAQVACERIADRPGPRVMIGGLGMGYTVRAAVDALPDDARVTVVELTPAVVRWCRGPLAPLTDSVLEDHRVRVEIGDAAAVIARAAQEESRRFDAIVLDLYEGPRSGRQVERDPFWGPAALDRTRRALRPEGLFSIWSEEADPHFEKRLKKAGLGAERVRPKSGGPRHVVYVATPLATQPIRPRSRKGQPDRPASGRRDRRPGSRSAAKRRSR